MNATPKTIAVTGATGFTGPFVVRALRERFPSAKLRAVVRHSSDITPIQDTGIEISIGDLRDQAALRAAFDGADTLVNIASLGFDWVENIVRSADSAGIRRAIFIGTTAILTGLPVASKPIRERSEQLIKESPLAWTILRPTMIYGTPEDRNIARLIKFVRRCPVIPIVSSNALQQPIHVEDVASAVVSALEAEATIRRTYNLSGMAPIQLDHLVQEVVHALGYRRLIVEVPSKPLVAVLALWSRLGTPPLRVEQILRIAENKSFRHDDAARDFGFAPRSFQAGIRAEVCLFSNKGRAPRAATD